MAQQRRGRASSGGKARSTSSSTKARTLAPAEAVRRAREQVEELLGRPTETVSSFSADGRSGWLVTVEVVELERIPPSTSLIASYEAKLDRSGDLVEIKRLRRYPRNQADRPEEEER
jgi:hypothetical protein